MAHRLLPGAALAALLCSLTVAAQPAATYPNKPVRVFAAGVGTTSDFTARYLGPQLAAKWNEGVIVENRAGAAGTLAATAVAKSSPDAYTLLMGEAASLAIAPSLMPTLEYDPQKSFVPITLAARSPMAVVVHPSVAATSLAELVAHSKRHPGKLNYSTGGSGTISHLTTALFIEQSGADLTHVPYKGASNAILAVVAGDVHVASIAVSSAIPQIRAGKVRVLAVTSERRLPELPDCPTGGESGFPGLIAEAWFGLLAPAQTPPALVQRIAADVKEVLEKPATIAAFQLQGAQVAPSNSEEFARFIRSENEKWSRVVKAAKMRLD